MSQQKLFALQIFSDRLMEGRIRREANLKLIKTLDDTILTRSLTDISNRAVLDILRDSIWDTTSATTRENAIIEFAKLYNNKEYRMETIDAVIPRGYHLKKFEPLISIAKFFYYLEVYSDSLLYGTKLDSARFASIQKSVFHKTKPHLRYYLDICLKNFRYKDIDYSKEKGLPNLKENNKTPNLMDD
ncbi:hypothetical protein LJE86_15755 [bacterium BMS3Abin03]|nr:hypothetical protein [bacterium BMS3Abin03]